jgi:hypothetical protein
MGRKEEKEEEGEDSPTVVSVEKVLRDEAGHLSTIGAAGEVCIGGCPTFCLFLLSGFLPSSRSLLST